MKPMNDVAYLAQSFHTYWEHELTYPQAAPTVAKETRYIIVKERDVSYRFTLHQHPYVRQLTQRLLQRGVPGLQAADTDYTADNAALAGSVEVTLPTHTGVTLPKGARIALTAAVTVQVGGAPFDLAADLELAIAAAATGEVPDGMHVTLVAEVTPTRPPGSVFALPADSKAVAFEHTRVILGAGATAMYGDMAVPLPAGVAAVLARGTEITVLGAVNATMLKGKRKPTLFADFFDAFYKPNTQLVQRPYPVKDLDFTSGGAYAAYNWELFFHVPLTIAIHLSRNQRFAEAQRWFHFLFDPTDDSDDPTPERFWKVRPFQYTDVRKIEEILLNLATGADETLRLETISSINKWKDEPFRPHVIARFRQQAYMYKTVMAYLDNLIAWGDSLFRQDTGEAIDEALMLYVMAANILGPRPQPVPQKGRVRPQTYANLRADLKEFGTVLRSMEPELPFDLMPLPDAGEGDNAQLAMLRGMGKALYFCVPRNDKLLSYWDTVADRLFKIRNSLNFRGAFRQLALFEPPIDPAMLARAAAAGLDVGAIVNGLNQPLPLVRFQLLAQKASEIVQEVKTLGNSLLSAIEKEDGEAITLLRAKHELMVLEMVEHVKYGQLQETIKAKEGLLQTLALAVQRYTYYERQLGKQIEDIKKAIPDLIDLDRANLDKMNLSALEPELALREIDVDIAQDLGDSGGKIISSHEKQEIAKLHESRDLNDAAATKDKIAAGLSLLPELGIDLHFWGMGGHVSFGGSALSKSMSFWASFGKTDAEKKSFESGNSSRIGSYSRREQDWAFQSNLAAGEIAQVFKQLRAAQIREAVAQRELDNHRQQIKQAEEIEFFLTGERNPKWTQPIDPKEKKIANRALYAWMKREVKALYGQFFQFAFDIAKKAERALQHELGDPNLSYLQFGYLAGKEGLLAGEKLYLDIKRMEMAYHDLNQREYELTKHVSLLQVDPLALIQLRATGRCTVRLPESLFDMDGPGHYFRRVKTVAVSIPCVTGPYASVNCTLTLLKSSIRKTQILRDGEYAREDAEDDRFSDYFGSMQSIVTSSAQNDSGMFETNLRDERYLPFENSGVISEWQLELPADPRNDDPRQFDYDTISDVILHVRYSAREGGRLLRKGAMDNLGKAIEEAQAAGSVRLFSIRHEFPAEWAKFTAPQAGGAPPAILVVEVRPEHFPFWSKDRLGAIMEVKQIAQKDKEITGPDQPAGTAVLINHRADGSEESHDIANLAQIGEQAFSDTFLLRLSLDVADNKLNNLWLALKWGKV
jgi:hypothetical protein